MERKHESESSYEYKGKFSCPRDAVLFDIDLQGWSNESAGDVEAPTGDFSRCTITPAELSELAEAFSDEIARENLDPTELVGHWLLIHTEQGFFHVVGYDSEAELAKDFQELERAFIAWEAS